MEVSKEVSVLSEQDMVDRLVSCTDPSPVSLAATSDLNVELSGEYVLVAGEVELSSETSDVGSTRVGKSQGAIRYDAAYNVADPVQSHTDIIACNTRGVALVSISLAELDLGLSGRLELFEVRLTCFKHI